MKGQFDVHWGLCVSRGPGFCGKEPCLLAGQGPSPKPALQCCELALFVDMWELEA